MAKTKKATKPKSSKVKKAKQVRKTVEARKNVEQVVAESTTVNPEDQMPEFLQSNRVRYGLGVGFFVLVLVFLFRSWIVAATVNGTPIFRWNVIRELERQGGSEVLDSMITQELVLQKAKEEGVSVSEAELDEKIASISATLGETSIEDALAMQGMTMEELRGQIELQVLAERMSAGAGEVTDAQVAEYIEENGDFFPEEMTDEERAEFARDQLESQGAQNATGQWLEGLREAARINFWVRY